MSVRAPFHGILAFFALTAQCFAADPLHFVTEDYPPFNFEDPRTHEAAGISSDLLREALRRAGLTADFKVMPWKRAYASAQEQKDTCVYSTTLTEERKPLFKWVGPLVNNDMVLFAAPDSKIAIATLDDAKPYTIGVYQGDAIETYLHERGFKLDSAQNDGINAKKLEAGRIDLWASSGELAPRLARAAGMTGLKPLLTFQKTVLDLACNPAVDDKSIAALNAALDGMRADGKDVTIKALTQ